MVAVTGGTGFIGVKLVEALIKEGHEIRVLTRDINKAKALFPESVNFFVDDLTRVDFDSESFLNGVDVLFACAGETNDESKMTALHVDSTRKLSASAGGRIKHWIQLGSTGVYGNFLNTIVTEETAKNPNGNYEKTKHLADTIIIENATRGGYAYSIVQPTIVFSADMVNQSLFAMIEMVRKRRFFFIGNGEPTANYVHVDNVIAALIACSKNKNAKNQEFIVSDCISQKEFVSTITNFFKTPPITLHIPKFIVFPLVLLLGKFPKFPLTKNRYYSLTGKTIYSSEKIKKTLMYSLQKSTIAGLNETLEIRYKEKI